MLLLLPLLDGCKKVEPAPAEIDDLFHWMWTQVDEGEDAEIVEGLVNLDLAVDGAGLEDPMDGSLTVLSTEEAELVGVTDRDPALAAGIFLANTFPCDFDQLEQILSYGPQDELYTGVYKSYSRDYATNRDDWLAGDVPRLEYTLDYTATVITSQYSAHMDGLIRRVADFEELDVPSGPFLLQRSVMPHPGQFGDDGESKGRSMDQDYQLEIYWPHGGDRVLHAYAMWRQADWGAGFDSNDSGVQRTLLNSLIDWDKDTAKLCEEGRP
ncbi:MAG: hypothetical protein KC621_05125 [Myxococcales bacterium]|nr:hypothetical protein [Myxococcales bacterium]